MQAIDRAEREKTAYNEGLRRSRYNGIFRQAHHLYRRRRHAVVGEMLRALPHDRVLELGSTAWTLFFEQNGIYPRHLTCINISERELEQGVDAARASRLRPRFEIMDAHALAFPDATFDVVFGVSILHHLDVDTALREVRRVLKPSGVMIFAEPLDMNPIGRAVRALTPKARTDDERPFREGELRLLSRHFACELHFEQLFSVPAGIVAGALFDNEDNPLTRLAFNLDESMQRAFPPIGKYYRHVLVVGRPRPGAARSN